MTPRIFGIISAILVFGSVFPYCFRIYQGKTRPVLTSYVLWTVVSAALLITYDSSGAKESIWPAFFGFVNPFVITILIRWKQGKWTPPDRIEKVCIVICALSLALWAAVRKEQHMAQYALYLAITADACAIIPTAVQYMKNPMLDRPFAWLMYAIGYGMGMFAIEEHTFANYALPAYMCIGATCIATPLFIYRVRNRIPLSEWI